MVGSHDQPTDPEALLRARGVTRREAEVLAAVAHRLSNGEIAAALGISKRTVESHVSALLAKLDGGGRAALIALGASLAARAPRPGGPAGSPIVPPRGAPTSTVQRTPLVGRGPEMAELTGHLEATIAGRGRLVVLAGEPGVGKTRLTEELGVRACRRGVQVLVGHCHEAENTPPYAPFVQVLERAWMRARSPAAFRALLGTEAPEIAKLLPGLRRRYHDIGPAADLAVEQAREHLFSCVRATLSRLAEHTPLVLVLEDVHWADEPTLLLLEHLADRLAEARVLMVATHRDADADMWPTLAHSLERLVRRRLANRMWIRCLDEAEVADMIAALAAQAPPRSLVHQIFADTEGNAFFVEEMVRHLAEESRLFDPDGLLRNSVRRDATDIPGSVRLVIGRRLERLTAPTRWVLAVAAVIGRFFDVTVLERTLAGEEILTALDEAAAAGLVGSMLTDGDAERFGFLHTLIQQALLVGLASPRRRRIHLGVAEAIIALHAGAPDELGERAAEIAFHLHAADDPGCAANLLHHSLLAGQWALRGAAFEAALAHLDRAAGLLAIATAEQRAALFDALGTAHISLGRIDDALVAWERALDEYEALGDVDAIGALCLALGLRLATAARFAEASALTRRGLSVLGEKVSTERARLLARLGLIAVYDGDPASGDALFEEALMVIDEVGDEVGDETTKRAIFGDIAGGYAGCLRMAEVAEMGIEARRRAGDHWHTADMLWPLAWGLACLGRLDEADTVSDELLILTERTRHHSAAIWGHRARGICEFFRTGDLDAYAAFALRDREMLTEHMQGAWLGTSYAFLGHAEFLRGNWDAAGTWLGRGPVQTGPNLAGSCSAAWFLYLAYLGRRADAYAVFLRHRSELPVSGRPNTVGSWSLLLGFTEGLYLLGKHEEPAAWYPLVVEAGTVSRALTTNVAPLQLLERVAGIAAAAAREWDRAETHFRQSLTQAETTPLQVERYEVRRFYARMLAERNRGGDREHAQRLLREAVDGFTRLGMPRHADLAGTAIAELR